LLIALDKIQERLELSCLKNKLEDKNLINGLTGMKSTTYLWLIFNKDKRKDVKEQILKI
jgi:hypothetical protein